MVLRLLVFNAEAWLAAHLNTHLTDPDEYRALTRHLTARRRARRLHHHHDRDHPGPPTPCPRPGPAHRGAQRDGSLIARRQPPTDQPTRDALNLYGQIVGTETLSNSERSFSDGDFFKRFCNSPSILLIRPCGGVEDKLSIPSAMSCAHTSMP
jgi:hypothetical protein